MSSSLQYTALTRLLTLNNWVHDLENELCGVKMPVRLTSDGNEVEEDVSRIAVLQEQIDQGVRASLATCWLGTETDLDA